MKINRHKKIGEIVAENIKAAHVFKKNKIDFCCGGGKEIYEVCKKKKINYTELKKELISIGHPKKKFNYNSWDLNFLIEHIINVHHKYVNESITIIKEYCRKVSKVHGHYYKEVVKIENNFNELAVELISHMNKEEVILFPYIKRLNSIKKHKNVKPDSIFRSVINPIKMLESEHKLAAQILKYIKKDSNNYTPPKESCNTHRALYSKLEEFEQDLFIHIHLENNILHPKVITLEKTLKYN